MSAVKEIKNSNKNISHTEDMFDEKPIWGRFLPKVTEIESNEIRVTEWDIPYTISQLSYLTHNHYRYYGKFPSVVAGQILEQFKPKHKNDYVFDNFCGSGTTLVEAKPRGINSVGIDISWLSALASNVKVMEVDFKKLENYKTELLQTIETEIDFKIEDDEKRDKWFSREVSKKLYVVQRYLLSLAESAERRFLLLAFLAIIRRVSKAYDGEVRPHINKKKKQRDVTEALRKKIDEMVIRHKEFLSVCDDEVGSKCLVADNIELPDLKTKGNCYLAISHPPYLNSFNYAPVFNLEFYWGRVFEEEYSIGSDYYKNELIAHPANEKNTEKYFEHLKCCYSAIYDIQKKDGLLAVVIGDCTRQGKLVPVIDRVIKDTESLGYKLEEVNYRTTHYGLGKYAYNHRADYHSEAAKKRDAIIVFRK